MSALTELALAAALPVREHGLRAFQAGQAATQAGVSGMSPVQALVAGETNGAAKTEAGLIAQAMSNASASVYTTTNPAVAGVFVQYGWLQRLPVTTPGQFRFEVTPAGRIAAQPKR